MAISGILKVMIMSNLLLLVITTSRIIITNLLPNHKVTTQHKIYNQSHTRNHHHQSINRESKHQPQPAHKVQPRTIPNLTGRLLIKNQVANITPLSNSKLMNTLTQAPETARNSMSMLWRSTRPVGMRGRNITE